MGVIASYSESNDDDIGRLAVDFGAVGESFASGIGGTLDKITVDLNRVGSPGGAARIVVFDHSGTYGTSSVWGSNDLAYSDDVTVNGISTSQGLVDFVFSGADKISLSASTNYTFLLELSGGSYNASNYVAVWADTTSPTYSGNMIIDGGAEAGLDMGFYVYVDDVVSAGIRSMRQLVGHGQGTRD